MEDNNQSATHNFSSEFEGFQDSRGKNNPEKKSSEPINPYLVHKSLGAGKKFYISEFLAEKVIQVVALLSIGFIIAIFYYVFNEAKYAFQDPNKHNTTEITSSPNSVSSNISNKTDDGNSKTDSQNLNNSDLKPASYGESSGDLKPKSYGESEQELKPATYGESSEDLKPKSYGEAEQELKPTSYGETNDDLKPKSYGESEQKKTPEESQSGNTSHGSETVSSQSSLETGRTASASSESAGENKKVIVKEFILPNDTIEGKSQFIWQPIGKEPKYSFIPLFVGALKVTLIGLLIAAPIAILAAIFTSVFAPRWIREIMKPAIEILAGFPSVVIGFFCLITLASVVQNVFGTTFRLNSFVGGLGMSLAVIPIIFTVTEDALAAVPKYLKEASLALGASRWQTAWRVILPAATPGVFAAIILGFGRAFGETMIALMATGNAALVSADIFESVRTMAATVGAEMAEVEFHGVHYGVLFLIGAILFVITFTLNAVAEFYVRKRLLKKFQGN